MLGLDQDELGQLLPAELLLGGHEAMVTMPTAHWHLQAVTCDVHISGAGRETWVNKCVKMMQTLTRVQEAHICILGGRFCLCRCWCQPEV